MSNFLSINVITHHLIRHFQDKENTEWIVGDNSHIRHMPWSELYFITLYNNSGEKRQMVVKMFRFPDQTAVEVSWQSDELQMRAQREYNSMNLIHDHFMQLPNNNRLSSITPIAYLSDINAIVMEFIEGTSLYDAYLRSLKIDPLAANTALKETGQWLSWLHQLPDNDVPDNRKYSNKHAVDALLDEIKQLNTMNISSSKWSPIIEKLAQIPDSQKVWCHCDFHLRNVLIKPDRTLLGFDTALERHDSPYFDIGKLIADLQTRRSRILYRGFIPSQKTVNKLSQAFLDGYFSNTETTFNEPEMLLYEGRFLFQKWKESLEQLNDKFAAKPFAVAGTILKASIINPTFHKITDRWVERVQMSFS